VTGEAGTLIAFRANVVHEVEPVTRGVRYTTVCRFCSAVERQAPAREDGNTTSNGAS
jgi:predicted 2-oxoglutarate/Fe(II)-dependent dioxygenase YbiX